MSIENLVEMSNRYGTNEEFVLAGGGNTSFKDNGILYVKGSGVQLSDIKPEQFVAVDIQKLLKTVERDYPEGMNGSEREEIALSDMMSARLSGEEEKRPSVETILHAMFPFKFVLHVHPPLINGLTCAVNGKAMCIELFGDNAVWVDIATPGLVSAQACYKAFNAYAKKAGSSPQIVFLQNHGIFIAADSIVEIDKLMEYVTDTIKSHIKELPSFTKVEYDEKLADSIASHLAILSSFEDSAGTLFCTSDRVLSFVTDIEAFKPISKSFTPDHLVNCYDEPLFIEQDADIEKEFNAYKTKKGNNPKVVAVCGLGFFALAENRRNAERIIASYLDIIKVATYANSFGGPNPPTDDFTSFVLSWSA